VTPGGKAIPFHASVRIGLTGGSPIKDKDGNVIGIGTNFTIKKNKVAPPHKKVPLQILFGHGIEETESICDLLSKAKVIERNGKKYEVKTSGGWKNFSVIDSETGEVLVDKKFQKAGFGEMLESEELGPHLAEMIDDIMVVNTAGKLPPSNEEGEDDEEEVIDPEE
jgi:recombination protein RecA